MKTTSIRARTLACALLAGTAYCGLSAQPAAAQTLDTAPPVRSSHDENGVDVSRGYFKTQVSDVSIGPDGPGGLAYTRSFGSALAGGGSNYDLGVFPSTGQTLVGVGGRSYAFAPSGSAFVSTDGSGATLTRSGAVYTLTTEDGIVIVYGYAVVATAEPNRQARGTSITYPSGEKISLSWVDVTWCVVSNQDVCSPNNLRTAVRLQAVSSSLGYQLHFNYGRGDIILPAHAAAWKQLNGISAINTAVDYCDPAAHDCSLSPGWPTVGYSGGSVTDTRGYATAYSSSPSGYTITRPGGSSPNVTVSQDVNARVTSVVRDGMTWTYGYSLSGTVATMTVTDPLGHQRVYTSDTNVGLPTAIQDENGLTTEFQYDGSGRLTRVTAPEDNYVQYTYDARGNVTQAQRVSKTGTGATILASATYPASCSNAPTCNKPTSTTDERGNTTDYTYDSAHGGPLTVTAPAPSAGATRPQTRYTYASLQAYVKNSAGAIVASGVPTARLTAVSACRTQASCAGSADEVKTAIAYGSAGVANNLLPTSVTIGAGDNSQTATTGVAYDAIGNVQTVDGPLAGTADTTRLRYDPGRLPIGSVSPDPDGTGALKPRAVRTAYNALGQPTKVERGNVDSQSDADWADFAPAEAVETVYDDAARPVVQKLISGATPYALTQTSYDGESRVDCIAQRMNPAEFGSLPADACTLDTAGAYGPDRIVRTLYDPGDRITQVKTAFGVTGQEANEVTTTYTANGQVQTVKDGENNLTTYEYDGHDRLAKTRFPNTAKGAGTSSTTDYEQPTYESLAGGTRTSGLVTAFRNRAAETLGFAYDALGRLTSKNLPGTEPDVAYAYDLLDRMISAATSSQTLAFAWDALGRQLSQTDGSLTYSSQYDLAGRRTRLTHPDGFYVLQEYLVTGEMTRISENGATSGVGVLATYGYDNLGRRSSLTFGNGESASYQYDAVSRLSQLVRNLGGTTNDLTLTFAYNPASQIDSTTRSNDLYAWTGHGSGSTSSTADGLNRLTVQGGTTLAYDARGNMISDGTRTYAYDSENKLTAFPATALHYDPLGRLDGAGAPLTLAYENYVDGLIAERTPGSSSVQRRHVFGPGTDEPLVAYEGAGTADRRFLHADERGSIVAVTSSAAGLLAINRYDEYGKPETTSTANMGRFLYTGQRYFGSPGLYYYKNRFYDPRLPRFIQTDPIGYGAGMNPYVYVGGDPVNFTDPLGLAPQDLECTGTRLCRVHDSSGNVSGSVQVFADVRGFGGGSRDVSGSSAKAGTDPAPGSDDTPAALGWWRRTWSKYGIPGDWSYMGSVSDWHASLASGGEIGSSSEGVDLACFSAVARARCAAAVAGALLMLNARIAARQLGLRIVTTITLSGGRSGQLVRSLVGPANSVIRGQGGRIFFTNGRGQVVRDITYGRARAVQPGVGFVGGKVPPSNKELRILDAMVGQ